MLVFVFGKETYLAHERCLQLKQAFLDKNPEAHLDELDLSESFDDKEVSEVLRGGGGLFATKKMVVLKDVFSTSDSKKKSFQQTLKDSGANKNDDIVALICESNPKLVKGALLKFLKKEAKVEEFKSLGPAEMRKWIEKKVGEFEGKTTIESRAVEALMQLANGNLWQLKNEIDKLCNFKSGGEITAEDVELFCKGKTSAKIFDLVDAIGQNNKTLALELKGQLISQGENEFYVFTMVVSQIRNLVKIEQCKSKGMFDERQIASKLSMHPFVVKKSLAQLNNFSKSQLKRIYQLTADLDLATKRGEQKMEEALDYIIAKI